MAGHDVRLGHGKKKAVSQALPPQNLLQPLLSFFLKLGQRHQYMPMVRKYMKIATFIALLPLLCGHNALNLTVTTVYQLAAVKQFFLRNNFFTTALLVNVYIHL